MENLSNDEFLEVVRKEVARRIAEDQKTIEANIFNGHGSVETDDAKLVALSLVLR